MEERYSGVLRKGNDGERSLHKKTGTLKRTNLDITMGQTIIEGVRARVSQPSFYNFLPVCSIMTFRTYYEGKSARVVN